MQLFLIRHGHSIKNIHDASGLDGDARYPDAPLTERGVLQASHLARYMAEKVELTHLYCSPMRRTLQTATHVGDALNLSPEIWVASHAIGGIDGYELLNRPAIQTEFPKVVIPDEVTDDGWYFSNRTEDTLTCQARAMRVARTLRQRAQSTPEDRIAIVSHSGFIDALLKTLFRMLPGYGFDFGMYYTSLLSLSLSPSGHVFLVYLNRTEHLPPDLMI